MTLSEICIELVAVEQKLMDGQISFSYDNLMSAMKPGHPAELLDEILADVYFESVIYGREVPLDRVKEFADELKAFKTDFKIRAMAAPLKKLTDYIKEQEEHAE